MVRFDAVRKPPICSDTDCSDGSQAGANEVSVLFTIPKPLVGVVSCLFFFSNEPVPPSCISWIPFLSGGSFVPHEVGEQCMVC